MNDRRRTGVNQVVLPDGNGGTMKVVTATAKTGQVILACVLALMGVIGGVYTAVKLGVNIEVEEAVEEMAADEHSGLHHAMVDIAEAEVEEVQAVFQDDLDVFEKQQIEDGKAIARIETNVGNLEKKIDDNKRDIIDEIRRERGGGV